MFFSILYATDTSNALEMLMRDPHCNSWTSSNPVPLLVEASRRGDTIAPFFLAYLREMKKLPANVVVPDLNMIPTHLTNGVKWVEAFRLYNEIKLLKIKKSTADIKKQLEEKQGRLKEIKPFGLLLMGDVAEKCDKDIDAAGEYYYEAAYYPNLLAVKIFSNFLKVRGMRRKEEDGSYRYHIALDKEAALYKKGVAAICKAYEAKEIDYNSKDLWDQWCIIHGEKQPWLLIFEYLNPNFNWCDYPITWNVAVAEARKWFDWRIKGSQLEYENIEWIFQEFRDHSFRKILPSSDTLEYNELLKDLIVFALNDQMIDYVREKLPDGSTKSFKSILLDMLEPVACQIFKFLSPAQRLQYKDYIVLNEWGFQAHEKHDFQLAEAFYRQVVKLSPDYRVGRRNLALILIDQEKYKGNIDLFLSVAKELDLRLVEVNQDGFGILNFLVKLALSQDVMSSVQLSKVLELKKKCTDFKCYIKDENGALQLSEPIGDWLPIMIEAKKAQEEAVALKKDLKKKFDDVKKLRKIDLDENNALKVTLLEVAFERSQIELVISNQEDRVVSESELIQIEPFIPQDDLEEKEDGGSDRIQKAYDELKELEKLPIRQLSLKDLIRARKLLSIILGTDISFSSKGKTSGSRVMFDGFSLHNQHGHDRLSPGAQHTVKEVIVKTISQARGS